MGVDVPDAVKVVTWANRGDEPAYAKDLTMMVMDPRAHGHAIAKGVIEWLEKGRLSECPTLGPEYVCGQTFAGGLAALARETQKEINECLPCLSAEMSA